MFLAEQELRYSKREIGKYKMQFTYKIPLPGKINLGLFFHFEINSLKFTTVVKGSG